MGTESYKSPYKFLDSFTQYDGDIFFGRDHEVEELYSKIFQSQLVLVYGASGTGKSSIINCGLANRFRNSDWLPINIRRGGNILRSMHRQIAREMVNPLSTSNNSAVDPETFREMLSSVFLDHFKPIYLIFDQFEELFIFGLEEEWRAFINTVRYLMNTDLDVHFIFVIRGEYLEFLSFFEEAIPDFFDNRVRIEKMTRRNAVEIIREPAKLYSIKLDEGFEENLLKKVSPDKAHVELTFIQVFLDRLYKKAVVEKTDDSPLFLKNSDLESIGKLGDVLAEFVDEQLFKMPNPKDALTVLKAFVSLQGTKTQMSEEDVQQYTRNIGNALGLDTIEIILSELVNRRILKEKDENGHYELRHDSLAQKIFEKITVQERELLDVQQFIRNSYNEYNKRGTLLNDEDLTYIAPFERVLTLDDSTQEYIKLSKKNSAKRRKSRRTRSVITLIILALTVTSVFGFFYSQNQKNKAEQMALLANEESREAQKQREVAQQQSELAHRQEEISKQQALIATQESERANEARADAVNQQKNAEYQKIIAEQQKQAAEQAKLLADRSAEEALQSKEIAENERQKAYTLRILGLVRELAIKSTYMLDKEPKALLALQAYNFNSVYGGKAFNSDLYRALLLARQKYSSADNNTIRAHKLAVSGMLPFRDQIISCSHDGKIILTGLGDNHKEQILESTNSAFETIALHPDNSKVVLGTQSGFITIYNLVARKFTFEKRIFNDESIKVLTTSDAIYAIGSNGSFQMMDWSGNEITSSSFQKQIVDAATNPSTGEVWIVTDKNEILVKKEGSVIQRFTIDQQNAVKAIEFDRTGKLAAVGFDNGTIGLLDPSSLKLSRLLSGHVSAITDLTVSEDGNYLASASYDRSVRLWKLDQLQDQPILLPDHDSWVSSVAFDKKGYIVVGTYNGTQLFYPLESSSLVNGLCGRIGRNLTLPEWQEYIGSDIQYEQTCKP